MRIIPCRTWLMSLVYISCQSHFVKTMIQIDEITVFFVWTLITTYQCSCRDYSSIGRSIHASKWSRIMLSSKNYRFWPKQGLSSIFLPEAMYHSLQSKRTLQNLTFEMSRRRTVKSLQCKEKSFSSSIWIFLEYSMMHFLFCDKHDWYGRGIVFLLTRTVLGIFRHKLIRMMCKC